MSNYNQIKYLFDYVIDEEESDDKNLGHFDSSNSEIISMEMVHSKIV